MNVFRRLRGNFRGEGGKHFRGAGGALLVGPAGTDAALMEWLNEPPFVSPSPAPLLPAGETTGGGKPLKNRGHLRGSRRLPMCGQVRGFVFRPYEPALAYLYGRELPRFQFHIKKRTGQPRALGHHVD